MRSSVGEDQALQSRAEADPREADGVWEGREPHAPWTTEPLNSDMIVGTSQVAQCLRLWESNAGGMGLIPGWGAKIPRSHMPCGINKNLQKTKAKNKTVTWCETTMKTYFAKWVALYSVQFSSVAQSCPTLCNPMNRSTPGLPVHHHLPEFTQTHIHRVGDAIQPSHPLSSPSPLAPNPSQHQSLFQWVNSSHEVAKVLEFQL